MSLREENKRIRFRRTVFKCAIFTLLCLLFAFIVKPDVVTNEPSDDAIDVWEMGSTCPPCPICVCPRCWYD